MAQIAWIGLGHMGGPMTANLIAAGHEVRGYDLSPAACAAAEAHGVRIVDDIAAALAGADACFTSLPMPAHVRSVYADENGIWAHADPHTLLLDTSTVDIATSRWCHDESARRGLAFVDSPISGGTAGAQAHSLTFMLGGAPEATARAHGFVTAMARTVIDCGGPTSGIGSKLVNNMMLFIDMLAVAEGSQLAEQLGLDQSVFWQVADSSTGQSWAQRTWWPSPDVVPTAAANHNFDATFSADLARKDCSLAVAAGKEAGVPLPAAALALAQLDELVARGLGGKDTSLMALFAVPEGQSLRGYAPDA